MLVLGNFDNNLKSSFKRMMKGKRCI